MMRAQLKQRQQQQQQQQQQRGPGSAGDGPSHGSSLGSSRAAPAFPDLRNCAAESDSPYVRRHADTPVSWQVLDADTLARAEAENKPIFMHIGFLADHRTP
jgi:hypothetical protein